MKTIAFELQRYAKVNFYNRWVMSRVDLIDLILTKLSMVTIGKYGGNVMQCDVFKYTCMLQH